MLIKMTDIENCTCENTNYISFENKQMTGKVVKVYDGDTVDICMHLGNSIYKFKCRLLHYDAPEIRSKNTYEKEISQISKKALESLVLDKVVSVHCKKYDKYGRILCEVITDTDVNVNQYMLDNHYGVPYNGKGKKPKFEVFYNNQYFSSLIN